jgi:hypothetical protein
VGAFARRAGAGWASGEMSVRVEERVRQRGVGDDAMRADFEAVWRCTSEPVPEGQGRLSG